MSGNNVQVRKYSIKFEIEVYDLAPGLAYGRAMQIMEDVIRRHRSIRVPQAIDEVAAVPNGGIEGEPHGETLDGWRCVFIVDEAKP